MLVKPTELKSKSNYKCLIYGQPGVGKTTLALSSSNPVLFDFEEGIYRVEKQFQVPSLQVKNFNEVMDTLNSEEIDCFETIVFDTLGRLIDCIVEQVKQDVVRSTLRQNDWGTVKMKFNNMIRTIYAKNKSVIFVAHETESKEEDNKTKKRPSTGSGSSGLSLINDMDIVGYCFIKDNKRVIAFTPSESFYAKNSLQLDDYLIIDNPNIKGNTFFQEKIVKMSKDKVKKDNELSIKYSNLMDIIRNNIEDLNTIEEINNFLNDMKNYETIWDSKYRAWDELQKKATTLNFTYDKEKKLFIKND